jgi:hypothetical protein
MKELRKYGGQILQGYNSSMVQAAGRIETGKRMNRYHIA